MRKYRKRYSSIRYQKETTTSRTDRAQFPRLFFYDNRFALLLPTNFALVLVLLRITVIIAILVIRRGSN